MYTICPNYPYKKLNLKDFDININEYSEIENNCKEDNYLGCYLHMQNKNNNKIYMILKINKNNIYKTFNTFIASDNKLLISSINKSKNIEDDKHFKLNLSNKIKKQLEICFEIIYYYHNNFYQKVYYHLEDNNYIYFILKNGISLNQIVIDTVFSNEEASLAILQLICAVKFIFDIKFDLINKKICYFFNVLMPENIIFNREEKTLRIKNFFMLKSLTINESYFKFIDYKKNINLLDMQYESPERLEFMQKNLSSITLDNNNLSFTDYCFDITYKDNKDTCFNSLYKDYTESCAVWTLGIILYKLLTGKMPFTGSNFQELKNNITNINTNISLDVIINNNAKDLINSMICKSTEKRIDFNKIIDHAYFRDFISADNLKKIKHKIKMKALKNSYKYKSILMIDSNKKKNSNINLLDNKNNIVAESHKGLFDKKNFSLDNYNLTNLNIISNYQGKESIDFTNFNLKEILTNQNIGIKNFIESLILKVKELTIENNNLKKINDKNSSLLFDNNNIISKIKKEKEVLYNSNKTNILDIEKLTNNNLKLYSDIRKKNNEIYLKDSNVKDLEDKVRNLNNKLTDLNIFYNKEIYNKDALIKRLENKIDFMINYSNKFITDNNCKNLFFTSECDKIYLLLTKCINEINPMLKALALSYKSTNNSINLDLNNIYNKNINNSINLIDNLKNNIELFNLKLNNELIANINYSNTIFDSKYLEKQISNIRTSINKKLSKEISNLLNNYNKINYNNWSNDLKSLKEKNNSKNPVELLYTNYLNIDKNNSFNTDTII